ncbi:hypothetical protein AVEN_218462-1 [Araneus ventricosus]|uniref:Uncharacterized protein n=1 Tax=Araneus ventricosus TaxID=182803 RepID=A0A4Y2LQR3_ARAVE|nr:hypothetical protein AVEN_218462-1 [Araneus ventricosus]
MGQVVHKKLSYVILPEWFPKRFARKCFRRQPMESEMATFPHTSLLSGIGLSIYLSVNTINQKSKYLEGRNLVCSLYTKLSTTAKFWTKSVHWRFLSLPVRVRVEEITHELTKLYCYKHGKSLPGNISLIVGRRHLQRFLLNIEGGHPMTLDLGDHFGDKAKILKNARMFAEDI